MILTQIFFREEGELLIHRRVGSIAAELVTGAQLVIYQTLALLQADPQLLHMTLLLSVERLSVDDSSIAPAQGVELAEAEHHVKHDSIRVFAPIAGTCQVLQAVG